MNISKKMLLTFSLSVLGVSAAWAGDNIEMEGRGAPSFHQPAPGPAARPQMPSRPSAPPARPMQPPSRPMQPPQRPIEQPRPPIAPVRPIIQPGHPPVAPGRPIEPVRPIGLRPGPAHVLDPIIIRGGEHQWPLVHLNFVRPLYYWNWVALRTVTCVAEDAYNDQYPITETGFVGIAYQSNLASIEDAAISRCYAQSPDATSCVLATCSPGY